MTNDGNINDGIIIDDYDRLDSDIDPPKTKLWKSKEWKMKPKEGKLNERAQKIKELTQKLKDWTTKTYLLKEKDITYGILPPPTTMIEKTNRCSMGWKNPIIGSHALSSISKDHVNVVNVS